MSIATMVRSRTAVIAAGVIVLLAIAVPVALTARAGQTLNGRYATATVGTGTVTQTLDLVGTVHAVNDATAAFPVSGKVATVSVSVGDRVTAGQTLATLDTHTLDESVQSAKAALLKAQAALEATTTSSSSTSGSNRTTPAPSGSSSELAAAIKQLSTVLEPVKAAQKAQSTACAPVLVSSSPTGPAPTGSTPTGTSTTTTSTATATPTATSTATSGPTAPEVAACASATRALVDAENKALQVMTQAATALHKAATASTSTSHTGSTSGSTAGAAPASGSGSQAAVLQAQQKLDAATTDLAGAVLTAPISGVVATEPFTVGEAAGTSTGIEVVGPGAATVTVDVPLAQMPTVKDGQNAQVVPDGAVTGVAGTVSRISLLPASSAGSSAGSSSAGSPSYPVVVDVPSPTAALASGATVTVELQTDAVTGVLTVPVSAITPTSTTSGTVTVLSDGKTSTTTVTIGAVGQGLAQVVKGLAEGQVVVLADRNAALPTTTGNARDLTGGAGGIRRFSGGTGSAPVSRG